MQTSDYFRFLQFKFVCSIRLIRFDSDINTDTDTDTALSPQQDGSSAVPDNTADKNNMYTLRSIIINNTLDYGCIRLDNVVID
mmetsp:Transcript_14727/g.16785  ORF Transcript_14727/g.16785 Transcript_14727/m.16785 type:complete len:83 (-) Transcript_14727:59-307(-)